MEKVALFIGNKTGSGRTTIALNTAEAISRARGIKAGFLELNSLMYDTQYMLNTSKNHEFRGRFEHEELKHEDNGFSLIWSDDAAATVKALNGMLDVLVVDCAMMPSKALMEMAHKIIITVTLNPADVKNASTLITSLLEKGYPAQMINVVVNKAENSLITAEDVRTIFKNVKVAAVIPYIKSMQETGGIYFGKKHNDGFNEGINGLAASILEGNANTKKAVSVEGICEGAVRADKSDAFNYDIIKSVHRKLFDMIEMKNLEKDALTHPEKKARIHEEIKRIIRQLLDGEKEAPADRDGREALVKCVFQEVTGLGAIEDLLSNPEISEVMVNRHDDIYIEMKGRLTKSRKRFTDDASVMRAIERIVMPLGRRIDESMPYVDARLPDGSRVNAIIPPLALDGPVLTIRKFSDKKLTAQDLVNFGSISAEAVDYLKAAVLKPENILISGGTGSGKTTLLNVLSSFIPENERVITVEDSAELKLTQEHVVRLESRPANIEGKGAVTIRDLVKNCLRMRPDRIVVGECRGAEALDMLQAMNTGHEGSMTTVHANTPKDALSRIDVMVLMAGVDLPLRAIREQVKSAVNIIVQQARMKDGSRKVTHISEITGMEGDTILMHDIFRFVQTGDGDNEVLLGRLERVDRLK